MTTRNASTETETSSTDEKETEMPETKTTPRKKTAARKPTEKTAAGRRGLKKTGAKRTRKTRAAAKPMTSAVREVAASIVGQAVESVMRNEDLGVKRSTTNELPGARQGMKSRIVLDDGSVITVTVQVR